MTGGGGNQGWWQARYDNRIPVQVADIPYVADDFQVVAPWNWIAGWQLLQEHSTVPQVTFRPVTPICAWGNCADRRGAYVQSWLNPDRTIHHVEVQYDPEFAYLLTVTTWQHELGHALGFTTNDGTGHEVGCGHTYRGVMSYCGFWTDRPGWWGSEDKTMLYNAAYGYWAG